MDELAIKVRDTMAGLVSAKFNGIVDCEVEAARKFLFAKKLRVVLHLEQARKPSRLYPLVVEKAHIKQKLTQKLRFADAHPKICDVQDFPKALGSARKK